MSEIGYTDEFITLHNLLKVAEAMDDLKDAVSKTNISQINTRDESTSLDLLNAAIATDDLKNAVTTTNLSQVYAADESSSLDLPEMTNATDDLEDVVTKTVPGEERNSSDTTDQEKESAGSKIIYRIGS